MEDSDLLPTSDLQPRRLSLIDVSCEDDSLIDSFTGDFKFSEDQVNRSLELFGGAAANKLDVVPENLKLNDQAIQPLGSLEPEVKKKGKYNLRESIAWNSAFLTGPGVLDAEELSSMIDGDKSETRMLPGIQEEVYRSTDTISTLESDTLTLESVEANLFEDVRASIQRSSNASKLVDESTKVGSGVPKDSSAIASKGVDSASQDKGRSRLTSKKTSIDLQKSGLRRQASRCPQVLQSVSSSGESTTSLLKRPKVLGNPNPSSASLTKRASTGGALLKIEKDSVKSTTSRGAPVPKAPLSSRIVPKPKPSTKTTTLGAPARREAASSSFNSSGGTASNNINKSPFNSKRKTDSRTDNTPSSASTFKTSPRIESSNKSQSGKSLRSPNLIPVTKLLSSISPASSVSEWSSESSRASLDTISLKSGSVDFDAPLISDMQSHAKDLSSRGHETQASGLLRRSVVKAPMERNGAVPPTSKPSGLRLPSPKIGFFDGVKSAGSTPNGSKQPHPLIPSSLPKSGTETGLTGGQSKGQLGTLQPARTVTKVGSKKLDTRQTAVNMKPTSPVPVQHSLKAAKEVLTPSRKSISPKVDCKLNPKTGMKNQLKGEKTGTEGHGIDIKEEENCFVEKNTSVALSIDQVKLELKDTPVKAAKVTPIDGDSTSLCEPFSTSDADQKIASAKMSKVAVLEPHNVKHDSHSLNAFEERKELQVEEQVHNLSRQVGALDISAETQQMLVGESLSSTQFQQ